MILRISGFAAVSLSLACSEGVGTVLQTRPPPADAGGEEPVLVLGQCAGERIDCTTPVEARAYEAGPAVECEQANLGQGSVVWTYPKHAITCPTPPCYLEYVLPEPTAVGALEIVGRLRAENQDGTGLWFARFGPNGELLEEAIRNFATATRLTIPKFYLLAGRDGAGNTFVVERPDETGIPVEAHLLRFDPVAWNEEALVTLENVLIVWAAIARDGSFAATITWPREGYNPDDPSLQTVRLDIARFAADGRLLWNQPKLTDNVALHYLDLAGFDDAGNLTVVLHESLDPETHGASLRDGAGLTPTTHRIVRLDPDGNVLTLHELPRTWTIDVNAAADGSVYIVREPLSTDSDGFAVVGPLVLERIDPGGRWDWILSFPDVGGSVSSGPLLDIDDEGNLLLSTLRMADWTAVFQVITPEGLRCERFEVPCLANAIGAPVCPSDMSEAGPTGSVYFSIGRAARPL